MVVYLRHELQGVYEAALLRKGSGSEYAREEIDPTHHLYRAHRVLLEQSSLPVGGEAVKHHVGTEQHHS